MLTGVAIVPTGLSGLGDLPFGWEFGVVATLLTLLFYIRVHVPKKRTARRASQRLPDDD